MKKHIRRDKKRRSLFSKHELDRISLRYLVNKIDLDKSVRLEAQIALNSLPRDSSRSRIRNRCVLTGRSRSVYRMFGLSRILLRDLSGHIPGLIKASW